MPRRAISITLDADNVAWLRGRAHAAKASVSGLVDQIVNAARVAGGRAVPAHSVVGTIDIDSSDPLLEHADAALRAAFDASLGRPLAVREARPEYQGRPAKRRAARKTTRG